MARFARTSSINPIIQKRSYRIDDLERIYRRFATLASAKVVADSLSDIRHNLSQFGITFEGRALPVSLVPTVVPASELSSLAEHALLIRGVLNRALDKFIIEHRERRFDGPMHRFFTPYYKWWDIIANESRKSDHIMLMRYDAVRDNHGLWSFMETNTCCPGGTIHCARIRDAWLSTRLGYQMTAREELSSFAADNPSGFVRFMALKAGEFDPTRPNIAILNYEGSYTNELTSLRDCYQELRRRGEIPCGDLLIGDIRDLLIKDGKAYLDEIPIALIYNKLDQLKIDPSNPDVGAWIEASRCSGTEFLNSLASMYLAETKRSLALLSDPNWSKYLSLSSDERTAIRGVIPFTRLIEDYADDASLSDSMPLRVPSAFVLKADALTRGSGVTIGSEVTEAQWTEALGETRRHNGVAQLKCSLPSRNAIHLLETGETKVVEEFFGIDIFLYGTEFAGLVSRAHVNPVFNIGNGGRESPVLIIGGLDD